MLHSYFSISCCKVLHDEVLFFRWSVRLEIDVTFDEVQYYRGMQLSWEGNRKDKNACLASTFCGAELNSMQFTWRLKKIAYHSCMRRSSVYVRKCLQQFSRLVLYETNL